MPIDPEEVRVAIDGVVSVGTYGSAVAPTSHSSALGTGWTDLGLVTSDGVTRATEQETEVLRAWQNNQRVRTLITEGEVTFEFVLMQTNADTVGFFHGSEVDADGSIVVDPTAERPRIAFNLDIIDGDSVIREYAPNAQVTEVGEQVAVSGEEFGWPVTVTASFDETLGGATKRWFSDLVTAP